MYGGGLGLAEPCVVANFVQTIDGVVAIPELERSNAIVAAESEADRFVVGLLRACADAVLIGARTMLASPRGLWRPEGVYRPAGDTYAELRARRGSGSRPAVAVVTTGASLDPAHPLLAEGALVLTTERAEPELRAAVPAASEVLAVNPGDRVDLGLALAALRERGHEVIVCEAGPTVFGELLAGGFVDELFVTISPLVAGRGASPRLSLAEGVELLPGRGAESELASVRRSDDHLFLRYRRRG
ncbi:MAG TPA: dihydrofolate reductase family protein [Gaiellaceae bacterium]|nr:dihydrofolate reductase family protein [Gaiellaceae bacterium]